MSKKSNKQIKKSLNNPFVLLQVILLASIRLLAVILGTILSVLTLAVHKWVASLIILAIVFITLYTMGVL